MGCSFFNDYGHQCMIGTVIFIEFLLPLIFYLTFTECVGTEQVWLICTICLNGVSLLTGILLQIVSWLESRQTEKSFEEDENKAQRDIELPNSKTYTLTEHLRKDDTSMKETKTIECLDWDVIESALIFVFMFMGVICTGFTIWGIFVLISGPESKCHEQRQWILILVLEAINTLWLTCYWCLTIMAYSPK